MDSPVLGGSPTHGPPQTRFVWSGGREAGQCAPDDRSLHSQLTLEKASAIDVQG